MVIDLHPAEWLYGPLFWLIGLTFLPTGEAKRLPLWKRALKRLAWRHAVPLLPRLKAKFPRLVMPGGYIDREFPCAVRARLSQRQSGDLAPIRLPIRRRADARSDDAGRTVLPQSGILRRWREQHYQCYALGFWAETLYHICLQAAASEHLAWLADAIVDLEDLALGIPPSMLGANPEVVAVGEQLPCPIPTAIRLRVANLSRNRRCVCWWSIRNLTIFS